MYSISHLNVFPVFLPADLRFISFSEFIDVLEAFLVAVLTIDEEKIRVLREAYRVLGGILETFDIMEDAEARKDLKAGLDDLKKGRAKDYGSIDEFLADLEPTD